MFLIDRLDEISNILVPISGNHRNLEDVINSSLFAILLNKVTSFTNSLIKVSNQLLLINTHSTCFAQALKQQSRKNNSRCCTITNSRNDTTSNSLQIITHSELDCTNKLQILQNRMTILGITSDVFLIAVCCILAIRTKRTSQCIGNSIQCIRLNLAQNILGYDIRVEIITHIERLLHLLYFFHSI